MGHRAHKSKQDAYGRQPEREALFETLSGHPVDDDDEIPTLRIDPALERKQAGRVEVARARRDSVVVERSLADLKAGASDDGVNLMPAIIECARGGTTEGEIVAALQEIFGLYAETPVY